MKKYIGQVEEIWQKYNEANLDNEVIKSYKKSIRLLIDELDKGKFRVAEKINGKWTTNEWVKKLILLAFKFFQSELISSSALNWFDKIPLKFGSNWEEDDFKRISIRTVPGSFVRKGAFLGKNVILMPCFVNIGAFIDDNTMIDTWSTVGSCAQIGKNCHISGGVGIGGILEPLQANPTIIEDNCFIGARSQISEGLVIEEGSVISNGVFLNQSTKIVDRETNEVFYGRVPAGSVIVSGSLPSEKKGGPSIYCAVIVKKVDSKTLSKTSINEILRF